MENGADTIEEKKPTASVLLTDQAADGSLLLSVEAIPGGHYLNILAKWIYDRGQGYATPEYAHLFSDPDGAVGSARIDVTEGDEGVIRVMVDFGEEGTSDDFYPVSHQLATLLVQDIVEKIKAGHAARGFIQ